MTTTIQINDNWQVEIDKYNNHQLIRYQAGGEVIKQGKYMGQLTKSKWLPLESYHKNMAMALRRIAEIELQEIGTTTLQGYIDRLEALYKQYLN